MFADAIKKLSPSVHAFIQTTKYYDPKSPPLTGFTGACTFIVVNEAGWILTAAHIVETYVKAQADLAAQAAYEKEVKNISAIPKLTPQQKNQRLRPLLPDLQPRTIIGYTWMTSFGIEHGPSAIDFILYKPADLALGKLINFDKSLVSEYPVFRNPDEPLELV